MYPHNALLLVGLISLSLVRPAILISRSTSELVNGCSLFPSDCMALSSLHFDGYITFTNLSFAAEDFGHIVSYPPAAVLRPGSTEDIVKLVRTVYLFCPNVSIAARGVGHSAYGQAQVQNGVVIDMSALKGIAVNVRGLYVDASGGDLWIDVLQESLKKGLSPRSFLDYLHLSVGGTLSNAGISGQTYFWGPQISNVLQLEIVTGVGDLIICSRSVRPDVFFAVLGGLGQFGIITKARINLQPAATNVVQVRAVYYDFGSFRRDQLRLISSAEFEYIEGQAVVNSDSDDGGYNSIPFANQSVNVDLLPDTPILYYIELAKNYDISTETPASVHDKVGSLLADLECIPTQVFTVDSPYLEFLERVHYTELILRAAGLWEVQHPWRTVFVPDSGMLAFESTVIRGLDPTTLNGPLVIYPVNRNKWDARMSVVTPDEDIFYAVSFLNSVVPGKAPTLQTMVDRNSFIWESCQRLGCKQLFPVHSALSDWEAHFGSKWKDFVLKKIQFDPKAMLAPNQKVLDRQTLSSLHATVGQHLSGEVSTHRRISALKQNTTHELAWRQDEAVSSVHASRHM